MATASVPHIFRWDMDKTYLRTEFDTVGDLIRTAFQRPAEKQNVPGSAELLRSLRLDASGNAEVYFVSGSPKQMRGVLAEKLKLDGIHYDGFVLKDNLDNILRGRFRAVKEQIGYKLPTLLRARSSVPQNSKETLFGDDAERDAFVYSLYADLCAGSISIDILETVLDIAGVYPDMRAAVLDGVDALTNHDAVERIIIHLDRKSPPIRFDAYGERVIPVYNYFQAALVLYADGRLRAPTIVRLVHGLITNHHFSSDILSRSYQDIIRRGPLHRTTAQKLADEVAETHAPKEVTDLLCKPPVDVSLHRRPPATQTLPDYPSLLKREIQRRRIQKSRRRRVWWPW